jgi:hypothetical protein
MPVLQLENEIMPQGKRRRLDPANLAGRWINTNSHGRGIQEIAIDVDRDEVRLRAFSIASEALCAWGTTQADGVYGSDVRAQTGMAFTARYDFGAFQTELQGNMNLGLLVVASFNRVGALGHDYFAREFYRRGDRAASPVSTPWSATSGHVGGDDPDELDRAATVLPFDGSEIFGDWWNTNLDSKGISRLRIDGDRNNTAVVSIWGAQVPDASQQASVRAALFALGSASRLAKAFSARYEANDVAITLQANIKQGVLVVASFTEFQGDDGRSNYFHREFYYRN